ncbi:MAG TPA: AI-2E family transporter [Candidatus Elarobacter sp.]|jgi:predicted PurR-regulated permease PerM|nr:AI-2E family transporter [Candidatus Elarobacter sp.]
MTPLALRRILIGVTVAAIVVGALLLAARIPRTVSIFLIAAFVAFGAHPLVKTLELRMPRAVAIAAVYAGLLSALVVLALVIVPVAYGQVLLLVGHAPQYVVESQNAVAHAESTLRDLLGNRVPLPSYDDVRVEVGNRVSGLLTTAVASVGAIVVGAVTALIVGTSALILSVFFLLHGGEVRDAILTFTPPRRRAGVGALMDEIVRVFGHFVAGQALLCAIVGAAVWVLLFPSHFAFALLVAVICALGYAIPFVGMIVAQLVAALLAIPQGTGMVIWVTVAIFVISRVADNVLVPRIMAQSVGVSPIVVMFAVFAGGELFGLPGLILGIPAAALLKVVLGYFVRPYIIRMQAEPSASVDVPVAVTP